MIVEALVALWFLSGVLSAAELLESNWSIVETGHCLYRKNVGSLTMKKDHRLDPRFEALRALDDMFQLDKRHPLGKTVMQAIRTSIEMGRRKGTTVVLYCMSDRKICNEILAQVRKDLEKSFEGCTVNIKANGEKETSAADSDEFARQTQNSILDAVKKCKNAVICFEDLDRISEGQMRSLVKAMSEGGSLMNGGETFASNEALYLLSMLGKDENAGLDEKDLRFEARQEFYNISVGDKTKDKAMELAAAFRRRIDYVYPINTDPCERTSPLQC